MSNYILVALIALLVGDYVGYRRAHIIVAIECERLGGFIVNDKVYECKLIRQVGKEEERAE